MPITHVEIRDKDSMNGLPYRGEPAVNAGALDAAVRRFPEFVRGMATVRPHMRSYWYVPEPMMAEIVAEYRRVVGAT